MTADRSDVAAAEAAVQSASSADGDSSKAGVGEAVDLPSAAGARGRGFDLGESDSLPRGSALSKP